MNRPWYLVLLLVAGCDVTMGPAMLHGSLWTEVREPILLSELCGTPISEHEVNSSARDTLKVDEIEAKRSLFGSKGHGTARVEFRPTGKPVCTGTVEFDFSQDSRITGRTRRSVRTSNTFYYANLVVKRK